MSGIVPDIMERTLYGDPNHNPVV